MVPYFGLKVGDLILGRGCRWSKGPRTRSAKSSADGEGRGGKVGSFTNG